MKQKILPINIFNSLIILGLLLTGGFSYAQNDPGPEEVHDTQNLDKLLKDYNKDQEKVLKDAQKMLPQDQGQAEGEGVEGSSDEADVILGKESTGPVLDPDDEKSKDGKVRIGIFDPNLLKRKKTVNKEPQVKYSEVIRVALEPLQKLPERELIKLLLENTDKSSAGEYIRRYPKLAVFTIRLIKDKNALPNFVKIADDHDKLIRFLGIMVATILLAMLLKRMMKKEGRPIWKAVSLWFFRLVIMTSLRFAILLLFFSEEITPIFKIAGKTFF